MVGRDTPSVSLWLPSPSKMEAKEMFGRKKIRRLEVRIAELEETVKQVGEGRNVEGAVPYEKKTGSKELSYEQVMDEWLNGKKAGEN